MNDCAIRILSAPITNTHLFYIGQAGFVFKSKSGQTLALDLYLSDCGERFEHSLGFKRLLPRILGPQEIVFDYIIATHSHFDHYDVDSMPFLMSNHHSHLFASVSCKKYVDEAVLDENRVSYVKPFDSFKAGDFTLFFTTCDHGLLEPDAVGVIIEVDEKRIFMAGDTCLRIDRQSEFLSRGPLDILIAPINGEYGNLNEEECAELSRALQPHLTIPCHYGLFARHKGLPGLFMEKMKEICPERQYTVLTMGECKAI